MILTGVTTITDGLVPVEVAIPNGPTPTEITIPNSTHSR